MNKFQREKIINSTQEQFSIWSERYEFGIWYRYFYRSYLFVLKKAKINNKKVLDIGCGTGQLCLLAKNQFRAKKVTGVDLSPEMIKIAKQKITGTDAISFYVAEAEKIPSRDDEFDVIFCLNSFHHYPDQRRALMEMKRVLKKEGRIFLLDPCTDGKLRAVWSNLLKIIFKERYASYHTKNTLSRLAKSVNLAIESTENFMYFTSLTIFHK